MIIIIEFISCDPLKISDSLRLTESHAVFKFALSCCSSRSSQEQRPLYLWNYFYRKKIVLIAVIAYVKTCKV